MSTLTKEQVKELVKGNNFQNVNDVTNYLKDIFKDIIQELLEAELEAKLGYSKGDTDSKNTDNSRNGYTPLYRWSYRTQRPHKPLHGSFKRA